MNLDILNTIMLELEITDVINLCGTNNLYLNICKDTSFWYSYFNKHDKIIPVDYTPNNLSDWKLLYVYNDFLPLAEMYDKPNMSHIFNMINDAYEYALTLIKKNKIYITIYHNPIFYKLLNKFTDTESYSTIKAIFNFQTNNLKIYNPNFLHLLSDDTLSYIEMLMLLVAILLGDYKIEGEQYCAIS